MTWLRDGAKVSAAKMETKAEGDSHSLVIKNATIEDVGEYICQAENVTSKTELEVQSKEEKIEVENHIMQQMGIKGEIFWNFWCFFVEFWLFFGTFLTNKSNPKRKHTVQG